MASFRTALLATAAATLSLAAAPRALANGLTFTDYTTTNGLGNNIVSGVYASVSSIYGATFGGGVSIAQLPQPVPGPLPLLGAASAFGFSRKLRRRLRAAATTSC
jgi:hypothetical protein